MDLLTVSTDLALYGSMELCAYVKHISRVSGEFWLLRVRAPRY